ncbi:MAG: alpha-amylase family glycosyl hydrolase, partial [Chloroflexota bacterium]|nr:alpha-amylase family glycosyl hydrolase [Chloroflexota bacterium]
YAPFLTNHDMDRAMSQLGDELEKAKLAATLLLTAPGVPFLYYGEEIGLLGKKPDEDIRRPMQWSATNHAGFTTGEPWRAPYPDFAEKNVAAQLADPNSLLAHYRRLIALRTQHVALRSGEFVKAKASAGTVLATMRVSPAQTVLVVINLGDEAVDEYTLTLEAGVLEAGVYAAESLWDKEMLLALTIDEAGAVKPYQPTTVLAPGETLIVELVRQ